MSDIREIRSAQAPRPVGPYAQAVVHAGMVYCSGQVPLDPATNTLVDGEIEVQTERVLANLRAVLAAGLVVAGARGAHHRLSRESTTSAHECGLRAAFRRRTASGALDGAGRATSPRRRRRDPT